MYIVFLIIDFISLINGSIALRKIIFKRKNEGKILIITLLLIQIVMTIGSYFEIVGTDYYEMILAIKLIIAGICFGDIVFLGITKEYLNIYVPRILFIFLWTINSFVFLLTLISGKCELLYSNILVKIINGHSYLIVEKTIFYYVYIVFKLISLVGIAIIIIKNLRKKSINNRHIGYWILIGITVIVIMALLKLINIYDNMNVFIIGTIIVIAVLNQVITRLDLIDIVDIAKESAIEGFQEGVLVVDKRYNYIYANKTALDNFFEIIGDKARSNNEEIKKMFFCDSGIIQKKKNQYKIEKYKLIGDKDIQYYIVWIINISEMVENNKKILQLKDIAEKSEKAKDQFINNMSHEIRTPMNSISCMAELLLKSNLTDIEFEYVNTINTASRSLLGLIDDILDYAAIQSGDMKFVLNEYIFSDLINEVAAIINSRIIGKDIVFTVFVDPAAPKILLGDRTRIQQVLINVLNNAVKFTEKGEVFFSIGWQEKRNGVIKLIFHVIDTGIGIKKEDMDKLFEKFAQVDTKRNRKVEGTGLGLPLAKKIAMLMKGDITVKSVYGKGSDFKIEIDQKVIEHRSIDSEGDINKYKYIVIEPNNYYLQKIIMMLDSILTEYIVINDIKELDNIEGLDNYVVIYDYKKYNELINQIRFLKKIAMIDWNDNINEDQKIKFVRKPIKIYDLEQILNREKEKVSGGYDKKIIAPKAKIAIVDDNEMNLKVEGVLFKKFGIEARLFKSGAEIIDSLKNGDRYDMIFIDYMMPDMNGIETVKEIKKIKSTFVRRIPIISLTATVIKGIENKFLEVGMNGCIFKPINIDILQKVLIQWLPENKVQYIEKSERKHTEII